MAPARSPRAADDHVVVIGAGIAGLAAAARLAQEGIAVTVVERHAGPGGKLRGLPSEIGPVDAGPTVLTMRHVFDSLFESLGERLDDHLRMIRLPVLARHFWPDGSRLDLFDNRDANAESIRAFAGNRATQEFLTFAARARTLFEGLDAPMMQAARPRLAPVARAILRNPALPRQAAPFSSLASLLDRSFSDPRLAQLFGRYATYVGGLPRHTPALLALIWHAEASGVWAVEGGLHRLAGTLADIVARRGAIFQYGAHVEQIGVQGGAVTGVTLAGGQELRAGTVLFNGDPRALACGALGADCRDIASAALKVPRSLSADVWAFAAGVRGPELEHHNVFFCADPESEFDLLSRGRRSETPTLYVCATDRTPMRPAGGVERFEIIANAPPIGGPAPADEVAECRTRTFRTLAGFGLLFDRAPPASSLTTPAMFNQLFPHSSGSLYGQSPHGLMAAFRRPAARTDVRGLYLAGGGTHPGAGLPMAALSARHAAEAILQDRTSRAPSRRTDTPGGMSTASATTAAEPSASSPS